MCNNEVVLEVAYILHMEDKAMSNTTSPRLPRYRFARISWSPLSPPQVTLWRDNLPTKVYRLPSESSLKRLLRCLNQITGNSHVNVELSVNQWTAVVSSTN